VGPILDALFLNAVPKLLRSQYRVWLKPPTPSERAIYLEHELDDSEQALAERNRELPEATTQRGAAPGHRRDVQVRPRLAGRSPESVAARRLRAVSFRGDSGFTF
jgi:hypothetical protein